jgi:hypothetical protein
MSFSRTGLIAVLLLAWTVTVLPAAPVSTETKDKAVSPTERVRKELDQPITIDIQNQPMELAINMLREQTRLNIVLDRFAIQQAMAATGMAVDLETGLPVTAKFKDVKARSALRSILTPFGLSFGIIGDTVLVSTDDMVMFRQLRQRVNVDLDKADLSGALKSLSRETATNLIIDNRVTKEAQTPVTLHMEDVPLETAVRLMVEMAGLKAVRVGNVLFVSSREHAAEMKADPDFAPGGVPGVPNPGGVLVPPGAGVPGGPMGPGAIVPGIGLPAVPGGAAPMVGPNVPAVEKPDVPKDQSAPPPPR